MKPVLIRIFSKIKTSAKYSIPALIVTAFLGAGPVLAVTTGTFSADDGTAAAPSYFFTNSTGTGMYLIGSNSMGFSTGGTQRMKIDSSGNTTVGGQLVLPSNTNQIVLGTTNTATISLASMSASDTYTLPSTGGTFCMQASTSCSFMVKSPTSSTTNTIQTTTSGIVGLTLKENASYRDGDMLDVVNIDSTPYNTFYIDPVGTPHFVDGPYFDQGITNPPFFVTSSIQVSNLNVSQLEGHTWELPGTLGSTSHRSPTGYFGTVDGTNVKVTGSGAGLYVQNNSQIYLNSAIRGYNVAVTNGATSTSVTLYPSQADTNYAITITPNWNTTVWVTGKSTTSFTVNYGTAAGASATIDWLLVR